MTFESIIRELNKKVYHSVYMLVGEEPYFIDIVMKRLENEILNEGERPFNQSVIYGKEATAGRVIDEATRLPMMAPRQVILLKEAQFMLDFDELLPYLKSPNPSTVLVIGYKKKPDGRKSVFSLLRKNSVYMESNVLQDYKIPTWIENWVSKRKMSIEPKASAMLVEFLGNNLVKISNELEKLLLNKKMEDTTITTADIELYIGFSKEFNAFELANAIGERNFHKGMRIALHMAENQKRYPMPLVLGSLNAFYLKLFQCIHHKKLPPGDIQKSVGISAFAWRSTYQNGVKNFSPGQMYESMHILAECDLKIKGVNNRKNEQGELLKEAVFKLLTV